MPRPCGLIQRFLSRGSRGSKENTATWSGVTPSSSRALGSAAAASKDSTADRDLNIAAWWRDVLPSLSRASGSAPASSRAFTTSGLLITAQRRGLFPSSSRALGSAPSDRQLTTSFDEAFSKKSAEFHAVQSAGVAARGGLQVITPRSRGVVSQGASLDVTFTFELKCPGELFRNLPCQFPSLPGKQTTEQWGHRNCSE